MAHGIMQEDKGLVQGDTWHGLPQYVTQDQPVSIEQARKVMAYPLEKQAVMCYTKDGHYQQVDGTYCIVRTDKDVVVVPAVGERFVVVDNSFILDWVSEHMLAKYPDLSIESVGTLFNGAKAFVNIKVDEFQVKGDKSPTLSRLMYYNPLGDGSYRACAHDIRIVCNNTLRASEAQGAANETLAKFRHTANGAAKINEHLDTLAAVKLQLEAHKVNLDMLAGVDLNTGTVDALLSAMFPVAEDDGRRKKALAGKRRDAVRELFDSDQDLVGGAAHSAYGMLQAVTNFYDHHSNTRGDAASQMWGNIVGDRGDSKDAAFNTIMEAAIAA